MIFKVSDAAFEAAHNSDVRVNGALDWLLGYFPASRADVRLLRHLRHDGRDLVAVDLDDDVVQQIESKFGACNDQLVTALLLIAFALGGPE